VVPVIFRRPVARSDQRMISHERPDAMRHRRMSRLRENQRLRSASANSSPSGPRELRRRSRRTTWRVQVESSSSAILSVTRVLVAAGCEQLVGIVANAG
jgi:hypothetical protein